MTIWVPAVESFSHHSVSRLAAPNLPPPWRCRCVFQVVWMVAVVGLWGRDVAHWVAACARVCWPGEGARAGLGAALVAGTKQQVDAAEVGRYVGSRKNTV